jgi:hypothetical protein
MNIGSHQHFWRYSTVDYPWIGLDMERIARDFLTVDLAEVAKPLGIRGSVAVQDTDRLHPLPRRGARRVWFGMAHVRHRLRRLPRQDAVLQLSADFGA